MTAVDPLPTLVNVSCRASQFDLQRTILAGLPFCDYDGAPVRCSACYTAQALLVSDASKPP